MTQPRALGFITLPVYLETSVIPPCVMTQVLPIGQLQLYQVRLFVGSGVTPGSRAPTPWNETKINSTNKFTKKRKKKGRA